MSKIIKLTSENVKRLHAVEITPNGNVVVIGGKNGQGKSSILDSIQYALGGDPDTKMPVRRGESKAKVVLDLGDIVVKRTFTAAGGTSLVVTNADGAPQKTPQAILDGLVGKLTFDPLAFSREKPERQAETLRALVGLDFKTQDDEHEKIFNERTIVNREAKALQARVAGMAIHPGLPDKEESTADILAEQQKVADQNRANDLKRQEVREAIATANNGKVKLANHDQRIHLFVEQIEVLEAQRKKLQEQRDAALPEINAAQTRAEMLASEVIPPDSDLSPFAARCKTVEETNRKFRENAQRAELVKQFKAKTDQAEKLTDKLEALESSKREATTKAKYPVEGLLFDSAGGVTLNGIPFEQCSAAEQLKVSIAVGLALNPKLRVLLIRDGSLLDESSMATVLEMAKAADAQVWMERVGTDAQTSVIIEDGSVQETSQPEPEEGKLL